MPTPDPAAPSAPQAPRRRRFPWVRWLVGIGAVVAAPAALLGGVAWTLGTDRGTAWALAQQDYVQVTELRGNLLDGFSAQRIVVTWGPQRQSRVIIDAPRASALQLAPGGARNWLRIHAAMASAERVRVQLEPSSSAPQLPQHLRVPVDVDVDSASVGSLELPGLEAHPFRDATGHVQLGADAGAAHRIDGLRFAIGVLQCRGSAQVGTGSDLQLRVNLDATQASDAQAPRIELPPWARALRQDWQAQLEAQGPLARFTAKLRLSAQAQYLDASADVAPLEPWPLPRLDARTEHFDLSALLAHAPATALSGTLVIAPLPGSAKALASRARFVNQRPGRWDHNALPVRTLAADVQLQPGTLQRFDVTALSAVLADENSDAGQVQGSGHWDSGKFGLKGKLVKVQPNLLDPRLATLAVSGPVTLKGQVAPAWMLDLQTELKGRLDRPAAGDVEFKVAAAGSELQIDVRELVAKAGAAQLTLAGSARRSAPGAAWQLDAKAVLADFDPVPWFPGDPQGSWRRGPHRFSGDAQFAFTLPSPAQLPANALDALEWLPTLQGEARVTLQPSQLAGVALRGEATLKSVSALRSRLAARLDVAGNSIAAQGEWSRGDAGRSDAWSVDLGAPQLARLGPLRALLDVPASWASPRGALDANLKLDGRWPQIRAEGTLKTEGLRVADVSVARGRANLRFDHEADSNLELNLDLSDARWQQSQAQSVKLALRGTPREHAIELRATLAAAPPAIAEFILGQRPSDDSGRALTALALDARGGLSLEPAAAARWRGNVQTLDLRSSAANAAPLLRLRDVVLDLSTGDAQSAPSVDVQAGQGELLGTVLRWEHAFWKGESPGTAAQFELKAQVDPVPIGPLLARAQPHLGWSGDLALGAHAHVRSTPNFSADVVLERVRGDLSVSDETGTQALQLTDLRLALGAHDGVWNLTQALAGKTLGEAVGAVTARVMPPQLVPSSETPIQGVLQVRVANLGTWGAWVPPGWRLAGSLETSAVIAGNVGAPEYTGQIRGTQIGVRNVVQGVNVTDGDVDIKLQGSSARIERFEAKAGAGVVRLEGGASLGDAPKAQLNLSADKFQLIGRVDRRVVASGSAKLQLDASALTLDGNFKLDEGLIDFTRGDAPTLGDDVRVAARPGTADASAGVGAEPARAVPSGPGRNVALDLQVSLGEQLRLRGRGLDTQLRGDLRLTTPGNKLAVNGTVRTASGTYAAYGQKLSIDRGELMFLGAVENPRLDIIATRPNLEQVVGVAVTGTALNPRVRLFSEPEMADIDKLSWLVLGRASDGLGRTDTALLQRAAIGLLAGEGTGPTDQLINAVGLDEVSFRQTEGEVRETVVSLGKQLGRRWYVGYERSLNATTGNWQLIYRIAQRLTLRAQSGLDNSLDAIWTWRWQ